MNEILYCVENQYGSVIARDLNLDNAMIFVRALFDRYQREDDISYTIVRQKELKEQYMKYRILKKKNTLSRIQYIADKIGGIERDILVEYFKKSGEMGLFIQPE